MKYDQNKSFGHPVLRPNSDDYAGGSFVPAISLKPVQSGEKNSIIDCVFGITIPELKELVDSKKAFYQLHLDCRDTFSRNSLETFNTHHEFSYATDMLSGEIEIACYLIAATRISDFFCTKINTEFGDGPFVFEEGYVLAQSEPLIHFVVPEKFHSIISLIRVEEKPELPLGEWYFDLYTERPTIYANAEQRKIFLQQSGAARPILVNTIILPMVAEMMRAIKGDDYGDLDNFPWKHIILDRLEKQELTLDSKGGDAYRLAQHFLGLPQRKTNAIIQGDF
jgi:hypothetical protein